MARNRRKTYEEAIKTTASADGIPCSECGCRHSYVVKTEKIGESVRRLRQCRHCGRQFHTTEAK